MKKKQYFQGREKQTVTFIYLLCTVNVWQFIEANVEGKIYSTYDTDNSFNEKTIGNYSMQELPPHKNWGKVPLR